LKKCIPNRELDELGEGLVMAYIRKAGMKVLPKCVDIEGLANSLGLKVIYEEFAEDDYDKIGFLSNGMTPLKVKRGNKVVSFTFPLGTIVVDTNLRRVRESGKRRFTIAHEVAHYILDIHNPAPQYQREFDSEKSYSCEELKAQFNMAETQADKLAASLLMPYFIVETALRDFNNGNRLPVYGDSVLASKDRTKINKMAAQIGVSFTALMIRLRQFQMLDYHPVYEYIEANIMKGVEM
jgi:Zn-dependent peptidase ImmA (M78 family)